VANNHGMPGVDGCFGVHLRRQFFKHTLPDGTRYHLVERCMGCGGNVRGAGVWVKHDEVRWHDLLVEDPWKAGGGDPRQGVLL
jgi:hypothetical protein